ncbi:hypothetical protein FNX24_21680 [Salmonella enterica]|nr:hypothetical protein [Salmonella enterica]
MRNDVAIIRVNNIEVGSMPVSQYEEIVKSVKKEWRTRIASVFSYISFVWKLILRLWHYFVHGISVIVALFMLYSLYHQVEVTQLINELRNANSEYISEMIREITTTCIILTLIAAILSILIQGTPVFVSATENAINKKIREVMEVPAEGQVSITFEKDGGYGVR